MMFGILAFLFILVASAVDVDNCKLSPSTYCPLFNFESDIVTPELISSQNVMDVRWILIYYSQVHPKQSAGKCNFRWHKSDSDNIVRREIICYIIDTKSCSGSEYKVKQKLDTCGRVEENSSEQRTMNAKFYSQDLSQYFWYEACYNYTVSGECEVGFLDLLVRGTRYSGNELDLQGLPWHLISADLKKNFNMSISDVKMKFTWKGPECEFDGSIKTSSASQRSGNDFAMLFTLSFFRYIALKMFLTAQLH